MAYSVGIFRKISQRPFQVPAYKRAPIAPTAEFVPVSTPIFLQRMPRVPGMRAFQQENIARRVAFGVAAAVPGVGFTFTRRERRNIRAVFNFRHQLRRNAPRRRVPTVGIRAPGWMEIIKQRTARYPKLMVREQFDVRDVFRERFGVTAPPPDVSSFIFRRTQRSQESFYFKRLRRAKRLQLPMGKTVSALVADIGWLVSYMTKRLYGHNLRR